jgi:tRNA (cmo5U34)-methyltransferase
MADENLHWSEENSDRFIDFGRFFVPEREYQMWTFSKLIRDPGIPFNMIELCCGEGILAEVFLEHFPNCTLYGLDGSQKMLEHASSRLAAYAERFKPGLFELKALDWRKTSPKAWAVVSSLAIHHLDGEGKRKLFADVYQMLLPGGTFLIADLVRPVDEKGMEYAANAYDEEVLRRSRALEGDNKAFDLFTRQEWNFFRFPDDPLDTPSSLFDQLNWLEQAGFGSVDVYWMRAGHALFGGKKL